MALFLIEAMEDLRDESTFAALFERHRTELQVHCYRMLGSLEDSEDLVQETFLRAWAGRTSFGAGGRFAVRPWLYRIATNRCIDVLRTRPRRVMPPDMGEPAQAPPRRLRRRPSFRGLAGHLRSLVTAANRQPAAAHYLRPPGESEHRPLAIDVLRIEDAGIAEITSFVSAGLFEAFGLPPVL